MLDSITIELVLLVLIGIIMFISLTVGIIQGFRKNTYYFCATIVFWIIFWVTAPIVTGRLILDSEWLFANISGIFTSSGMDVSSYSTLIEVLVDMLASSLEIDPVLASDPAVSNTLIAIIQSVAKLIYLPILAIFYFFIKIILYHAVFKRYLKANKRVLNKLKKKNDKYIEKHQEPNKKLEKRIKRVEKQVEYGYRNKLLGLASGAVRGLLTSFLVLCVVNSTVRLIPDLSKDDNLSASTEETNSHQTPSIYDFILSYTDNNPAVKTALDMIAEYQSSYLINTTGLKIGNKTADEIFIDSILSGKSKDYSFELRDELSTIIQIAESAYSLTNGFDIESVEWTKLSSNQVEDLQTIIILLSDTDLLNNLASVLVGAALSMDAVVPYMPDNLNVEEYKNIDWSNELKTIADLVSKVYSLGADLASLNYLDLDPEIVKEIMTSLSSLQSINFLGHVGSSYAIKTLVEDDPNYQSQIELIEQSLAEMAIDGSYSEDIKSFGDLYANFIDIYANTDFSAYQDEEGNITNYVAALTSVETTKYQGLVSTIFKTNFLTELLPNVLTIVKDKLIAENSPEIASIINPNVVTSSQWEKEINTMLQLIGNILKDEEGNIHPFESIEKYDFSLLSNFTTKTIVESELLSYAMIKIFIDTSNGVGILGKSAESVSEMICVPDYLATEADENHKFNVKWYGDSSNQYADGELFIMLDTIKNCMSELENLNYPASSIPAILARIDSNNLFTSDVLYYSVNKLIDSNREFVVVPLSETTTSDYEVKGEKITTMVKKDELKNVVNIFTDRNIIDLESLFVYINKVENEDGTVTEEVIDPSEKTEETIVKLDFSTEKILGLLTSDKLYNPENIEDTGVNIDKLFTSKILRATLTNMIDASLGEMIAVPSNSIETTNNVCLVYESSEEKGELVEKPIDIIRQDQFKSLLMAVKDLDVDLTIFTKEDSDPLTVIDSFKDDEGKLKEEAKPIFGSQGYTSSKYSGILHATLSKYIIEFSTINDENASIVVPLETLDDVDENLIESDEMVNLLNSIVILGSDILGSEVTNEQINSIIATVISENEVLDSDIIKATLTKMVIDTGTVTIPSNSLDKNTESEKIIAKTHIVDLLGAVESLRIESNTDNYMDMLDVNNLTVSLIKNANENNAISDSLIIRAILSEQMENNEITIPSTACDEEGTITVEETKALINAMDKILPSESTFTNIRIDDIRVKTLNNAKKEIKDSLLIKSLLTKALKENESIVVPQQALINDLITDTEIDNLISAMTLLLSEESSLTSINIDSIKLSNLDSSKQEIHDSYILNATITKQISDLGDEGTLIVPSIAYESEQLLSENEINHLISGMYTMLGGESSVTQINVETINVSSLTSARNNIAESSILNATITNKLIQQECIVVPSVAYKNDENQMLKSNEIVNILLGLENLLGSDTSISSIDVNNITTTSLNNAKENILSSFVLNATITSQLSEQERIVIPDGINHEETNEATDEKEMEALIIGLVSLLGENKTINNIDVSNISLADLQNSKEEINSSLILRATITNQINDQESLMIPSGSYETSQMFTTTELSNLIDGIVNLVGVDTSFNNINLDDITTTSLNDAKDNIAFSLILNATVTDKLNEQSSIIIPNYVIVENDTLTDPKIIDSNEMKNMISGLNKLFPETNINNIEVDSITIGSLDASKNEIALSLILNATITNKIENQVSVPTDAYDDNNKLLLDGDEIDSFISSLVLIFGTDTTLNNLPIDNLTIKNINDNIDSIIKSYILKETITDKIEEQPTILIPSTAYETTMLTGSEIKSMFNVLALLVDENNNINELTGFTSCDISVLATNANEIAISTILRTTISNDVLQLDMLKVPFVAIDQQIADYTVIESTEFINLFIALNDVYSGEISNENMDISNIKIPDEKASEIANSIIMRTTITQNISLKVDGEEKTVYAYNDINNIELYLSIDETTSYLVMTADELVRVIKSFNVLLGDKSGLSVTLDLQTIINASSNINTLLSSDVMEIAISDYLLDLSALYGTYEKETKDVITIPGGKGVNAKEKLTNDSIKIIVSSLSSVA